MNETSNQELNKTRERVLIVDGSNLCHRAFHAMSSTGMRDGDGNPVWALHGILTTLGSLVRDSGAKRVIVCRDLPGGCTERKAEIPEYKAHRSAPDADLRSQLDRYPELLKDLGIASVAVKDWEADDLLAACSREAMERGWEPIVVTSDKDAYQLVSKGVCLVKMEGGIVTDTVIERKHGVKSDLYQRLAALVGEPGDGIKGIDRVGAKTAAKMLAHWGEKLDDVIDNPDDLRACGLSQKLAESVAASAEVYRRNLKVTRLRDELDVKDAMDATNLRDLDGGSVIAIAREWGLPRAGASLWAGIGETSPF